MKEESRFNGEYHKIGTVTITDAENELVNKTNEDLSKLLDSFEGIQKAGIPELAQKPEKDR